MGGKREGEEKSQGALTLPLQRQPRGTSYEVSLGPSSSGVGVDTAVGHL